MEPRGQWKSVVGLASSMLTSATVAYAQQDPVSRMAVKASGAAQYASPAMVITGLIVTGGSILLSQTHHGHSEKLTAAAIGGALIMGAGAAVPFFY